MVRATVANVSGTVHYARLERATPLARDVVAYEFALPPDDAELRWRPGQFLSLHCGTQPDGLPILRSYTIASRPGSGRLQLVVKLVAGGPASEWFRRGRPRDEARFTGPMGFFVLDLSHVGDVVLGATGTGVAPFVPMIEELLERDEPGRVHLYWGLRDEGDRFWEDELAALARASGGRFAYTVSLSRPSEAWSGARGRIDARIFAAAPELSRPVFYLCGNGAMIREVKAGLVERGVDRKRQIRTEAFFD
jgi:ferredoxin-NADP reductase